MPAWALTTVVAFLLRLLSAKSRGNTASNVVPECRAAESDWIWSVPPICCNLARMAGIPTPITAFVPDFVRSAGKPRPLSLTVS